MQNLGLESVDIDNKMEANLGRFDQFLKQHKESQLRIGNSNPKLTSNYDKLLRMENSHFTCIYWKWEHYG